MGLTALGLMDGTVIAAVAAAGTAAVETTATRDAATVAAAAVEAAAVLACVAATAVWIWAAVPACPLAPEPACVPPLATPIRPPTTSGVTFTTPLKTTTRVVFAFAST